MQTRACLGKPPEKDWNCRCPKGKSTWGGGIVFNAGLPLVNGKEPEVGKECVEDHLILVNTRSVKKPYEVCATTGTVTMSYLHKSVDVASRIAASAAFCGKPI